MIELLARRQAETTNDHIVRLLGPSFIDSHILVFDIINFENIDV